MVATKQCCAWIHTDSMILSRQQAGGTKQQQDLTYQTCDDVQPGNAQCTNRDPTAPAYQWTPGVNKCPNSFKQTFAGFSASNFVNQPLCPDCLPSTQNHGSDGGGTTYFDDDLTIRRSVGCTRTYVHYRRHYGRLESRWCIDPNRSLDLFREDKNAPDPRLTHFFRFFSIWFSPSLSDFFWLF